MNKSKDYDYFSNKLLSGNLNSDIGEIKKILKGSEDVVYREFKVNGKRNSVLFFLDGFVDVEEVNSHILRPLNNYYRDVPDGETLNKYIKQEILSAKIKSGSNFKDIIDNVLSGDIVLLVDGEKEGFFIDFVKLKMRNLDEAVTEPVTRGPRDGFTEYLKTNITLVRRRLQTPRLKVINVKLGYLSKTKIVITFIEGIAEEELVREVKERVSKIKIDAVLESQYVEEFIEDNHFSIFPQVGFTERPDRLVSSLLEGHVGIMIDNTPIALIAPYVFVQFMQSSEDYYERYIPAFIMRTIRYIFLFLALFLPSIYIAVLTFHPGMIPKSLLINIWVSREDVPFPVFIEAILMEIFFEGLREAGVRMSKTASQTVSIVGALIIGQAAVQAGIVSASMVIVVSVTGIASFIMPRYDLGLSIRVLRFVMMILAGMFGLYGIFMGFLVIFIHMAKLKSFGVPYLTPIAPLNIKGLKDVIIRAPWWIMKKKSKSVQKKP